MTTAATPTKERLEEMVASVPFWFHSIDLGGGVLTPGHKSLETLRREAAHIPDVRGKSVLDIGAWDGFFSFEAERRGAARVVSLDQYVWEKDTEPWGGKPPAERPGELPGKRGYDVAHAALGSRAEPVVRDYLEYEGGPFEVVLYLGVLYHMPDPLGALQKVAELTKEVAVIETAAIYVQDSEHRPLFEFYPGDELQGDPSNWWAPNQAGLLAMCEAAGFKRVEVLAGAPGAGGRPLVGRARWRVGSALRRLRVRAPLPERFRALVRAWK